MTADLALAKELATIRKGRGLGEPKLADKTGPVLLARIGANASPSTERLSHGQIRLTLTDLLLTAARLLPADLRAMVEPMFAIGSHAGSHFNLGERQANLAVELGVDIRTIRRRCDGAVQLLAEVIVRDSFKSSNTQEERRHIANGEEGRRESVFASDTWHNERIFVLLRLDRTPITCREERTVVARIAGVSELTASTGLAGMDPQGVRRPATSEIEYGGVSILSKDYPGAVRVEHLRLPKSLAQQERHTYCRVLQADSEYILPPRYLYTPAVQCDEFDLRIRFSQEDRPGAVWAYADVPYRVADAGEESGEVLSVDEASEVRITFRNLHLGSTYGVGWQ